MERYPFEEPYRSRPISKVPKSWRYSNCLRDQTPCPTAISAAISTAATATLRHGNGYLTNLYTVTQCIQYTKLDWLLSFSWGAMSINSQTGWLLSIITEHAENHAPSALFLHLVLLRAAWKCTASLDCEKRVYHFKTFLFQARPPANVQQPKLT